MKIFFLGDIVGKSGRLTVIKNLKDIIKKNKKAYQLLQTKILRGIDQVIKLRELY